MLRSGNGEREKTVRRYMYLMTLDITDSLLILDNSSSKAPFGTSCTGWNDRQVIIN